MGIKIKITALAISILVISGCSNANSQPDEEMDHSMKNDEETDHSMMDMDDDMMENEHMSHDEVVSLNDSTGENELKIPSMLERDNKEEVAYTVRAWKGKLKYLMVLKQIRMATMGRF